MISIGICPVCEAGQVGYRVCSNRETVVLMCEECALVWTHPNHVSKEKAEDPVGADFLRRHPDCKLRPSRWALAEDVQHFGWGSYLLTLKSLLEEERGQVPKETQTS
jgi:hypothetical protein